MPKLEISYEMLLKWKKSAITNTLLNYENSSFTPKKYFLYNFKAQ